MQRKAYVPGVAALLAALLAGCTGGSGGGATADDSNPGQPGVATEAAEPGKYRTLPEPCAVVGHKALDTLLPGIEEIADEEQRARAYSGEPTLAYDTDRKVGCRWKVESAEATDHLFVDFERVVSYDGSVSDAGEAEELFAQQVEAADLPEPVVSESGSAASDSPSGSPSSSSGKSGEPGEPGVPAGGAGGTPSSSASAPSSSPSSSSTASPAEVQPRLLDDLGDEAFVDDALSSSGSTAKRRTVTVAFRTSNVMVTIEYAEQSATLGVVPDSEEMQDMARNLASQLADSLGG
ncbi:MULTISPECIES: DUF3558 domain-containing protein [unclassified Streptomyces]|uniref:DUF3558 domain-containing protein n=1 Tax=unclassified Streptomyces TaxID=2593676 RepID=UPI00087C78AC|nr:MULTISPECIES: DUF3558 domain-containing protein [unclassified Streptomyces]REH21654.1 hypothetical protein BX268_3489 [Streptomyces sp. 2221.1]SDT56806.1 hypothetical protein SAMN05428941_3479 [Streptomyces sp. 2114.2]